MNRKIKYDLPLTRSMSGVSMVTAVRAAGYHLGIPRFRSGKKAVSRETQSYFGNVTMSCELNVNTSSDLCVEGISVVQPRDLLVKSSPDCKCCVHGNLT